MLKLSYKIYAPLQYCVVSQKTQQNLEIYKIPIDNI